MGAKYTLSQKKATYNWIENNRETVNDINRGYYYRNQEHEQKRKRDYSTMRREFKKFLNILLD